MPLRVVFLTSDVPHHIWIINNVHKQFPVTQVFFQQVHLQQGSKLGLLKYSLSKGKPHLFVRRVASRLLFGRLRKRERKFEQEFFFGGAPARLADGIQVSTVETFNSAMSVAALQRVNPDVVIVCGTEFLRPEVLHCAKLGTVNIHRAILPLYRGGGLPEWNYYMNDFKNLGCTVHACSEKLDGGGIYAQRFYRIQPDHKYWQHRAHTTVLAVECLLEALRAFADGNAKPVIQGPGRTWSARKLTLWKEIIAHRNFRRYVRSLR